jgi:hypothetical protein
MHGVLAAFTVEGVAEGGLGSDCSCGRRSPRARAGSLASVCCDIKGMAHRDSGWEPVPLARSGSHDKVSEHGLCQWHLARTKRRKSDHARPPSLSPVLASASKLEPSGDHWQSKLDLKFET